MTSVADSPENSIPTLIERPNHLDKNGSIESELKRSRKLSISSDGDNTQHFNGITASDASARRRSHSSAKDGDSGRERKLSAKRREHVTDESPEPRSLECDVGGSSKTSDVEDSSRVHSSAHQRRSRSREQSLERRQRRSRSGSEGRRHRRGGHGDRRYSGHEESGRYTSSGGSDRVAPYDDDKPSRSGRTSLRHGRRSADERQRSLSDASSPRRGSSHRRSETRKRTRGRSRSPLRRRSHSREDSKASSRRDRDDRRSQSRKTEASSGVRGSTTDDSSSTKKARRTGWDSGPAAVPPMPTILPTLGGMGLASTGFTASLTGKTPQEIQEELAERQAQAASIAATMQMKASTSQLCRIYVGSLDYSLTENDIRQVFSAFGPITNVDMPKEGTRSKGFCFVEYASPESANMAITTMPGFNLKGRAIKVGRPTALGGQSNNAMTSMSVLMGGTPGLAPKAAGVNAAEAGQIAAAMLLAKADGSGFSQSDSQSRVYVGSVPYSFTSDDIKQIFDVFGKIISCQLIPSNERPGTHRGYGFIEYSTIEEARLAIETMNDFPVAGKVLKVNYATALRGGLPMGVGPGLGFTPPGIGLPTPMIPAAATGANAVPVVNQFLQNPGVPAAPVTVGADRVPTTPFGALLPPQSTTTITAVQPTNSGAAATPTPAPPTVTGATEPSTSTLVVLCNMVDSSEANDELKEEIQQECSKYGPVRCVEIVVHESNGAVRIFVNFEAPEHASAAVPALHDRWFGGRKIAAKRYDPSAFAARNYWL